MLWVDMRSSVYLGIERSKTLLLFAEGMVHAFNMKLKLGRKQFDGKDVLFVLQKLEEAFMLGGTDQEACIYADVSPSALYEYQKKNPEFLERKAALKNMPSLRAKKTIVDRLEKDTALAQWWLVRRNKREFGERYEEPPQERMNLSGEALKRSKKYHQSTSA